MISLRQVDWAKDPRAIEVFSGLRRNPKRLPTKYLYDGRGSELFKEITRIPEYYLTRCEMEILSKYASEIADYFFGRVDIIELGAGDGIKTGVLLNAFLRQGIDVHFCPIDVCGDSISALTWNLEKRFPDLRGKVEGVQGEYLSAFDKLERRAGRRCVLFLGSSVGNMSRFSARQFLSELRSRLSPRDFLLIGFDLKKEISILQHAYNDSLGVTKEFNLNILDHLNREMGSNFQRDFFEHYEFYNVAKGCMESWLISKARQQIFVAGMGPVFLEPSEGIHVEDSYKYDCEQVEKWCKESGFKLCRHFFDSRKYFLDSFWEVS